VEQFLIKTEHKVWQYVDKLRIWK